MRSHQFGKKVPAEAGLVRPVLRDRCSMKAKTRLVPLAASTARSRAGSAVTRECRDSSAESVAPRPTATRPQIKCWRLQKSFFTRNSSNNQRYSSPGPPGINGPRFRRGIPVCDSFSGSFRGGKHCLQCSVQYQLPHGRTLKAFKPVTTLDNASSLKIGRSRKGRIARTDSRPSRISPRPMFPTAARKSAST